MSERVHDNDETTIDTSSQAKESDYTDSGHEHEKGDSPPKKPKKKFIPPELYKD